jgi:putative endonuclease
MPGPRSKNRKSTGNASRNFYVLRTGQLRSTALYDLGPGIRRGERVEGELAFYVYILASKRNGTIYTGMTNDLYRRVTEHKAKTIPGFTTKHGCDKLVWFEQHPTREDAFRRERRIKEWRRSWKLMLIEENNPTWRDLFEDFHTELDAQAWLSQLAEGC